MRILIITSCTGEKVFEDKRQLTQADFAQGAAYVATRERELKNLLRPACELYTGEQQQRLMKGVQAIRQALGDGVQVDVRILSAGYGFVPEDRKIAPYECTFASMRVKELKQWAAFLKAPEGFREAVAEHYDLGLVLLGDSYLRACALGTDVNSGGPTLFFTGAGPAKRLPRLKNVRVVTLSNPEAKRFSCGLVGLKGEIGLRLLQKLIGEPDLIHRLKDPATDILALLDHQSGSEEAPVAKTAARVNPKVDRVITIPESWWKKPHRAKLRYFIPEWDDLVDPDYDFLNDQHSGGRGDWSNEVYSHQIYPEPNYDGILVSRAIAEKSKKKKARINSLGVHRFLRVPREFPIMGDCGAFDYIMEEKPPYSTENVIEYYNRLDFDYGVSVDHLIVKGTENVKKYRYELTIHNAEEFIKVHKKYGLNWEPIGAVQGWDSDSYARAACKYVKMGYKKIGLGGLVRSSTPEIIKVLQQVRSNIPTGIGIHLFGLARLRALHLMTEFGVTSVDSASSLRRAWLGGKDNYWTASGIHYRAIRVPEAGKSFRAKRMVSEKRASFSQVKRRETQCLESLRAYDKGICSIDQVLSSLADYDHLITPDRSVYMDEYRRTLEALPWKYCPCAICSKDGVETILFRGNNRNRRRGFHNTYVFYRLLQRIIETGDSSFLSADEEEPAAGDHKQLALFETS